MYTNEQLSEMHQAFLKKHLPFILKRINESYMCIKDNLYEDAVCHFGYFAKKTAIYNLETYVIGEILEREIAREEEAEKTALLHSQAVDESKIRALLVAAGGDLDIALMLISDNIAANIEEFKDKCYEIEQKYRYFREGCWIPEIIDQVNEYKRDLRQTGVWSIIMIALFIVAIIIGIVINK